MIYLFIIVLHFIIFLYFELFLSDEDPVWLKRLFIENFHCFHTWIYYYV